MENELLLHEQLRVEEERLDRERRLSHEMLRPYRMMVTTLTRDGNQWCVLFGPNIQEGVAGFGKSPDLASRDFDRAWYEEVEP